MASIARAATVLKSLHVPGKPLVVTNAWSRTSLSAIASLNPHPGSHPDNPVQAIATTSFAIAEEIGTTDPALTMDENLAACEPLARRAAELGIPITLDLQDGYADRLEECIARAVRFGAAGANIEDAIPGRSYAEGLDGCLYPLDEAVRRVRRVLATARDEGVADFVVNARTDVFRLEPPPEPEVAMEEAIRRGKAFLEAGATTVFVWGGARGLRDAEVKKLTEEFEGRLAVKIGKGQDALSTKQLAEIGVARISCGGEMAVRAKMAVKEAATTLLHGGRLE
jgi:2-methylisocitrate lyase-like PEP mutase family enzyme